MDHVTFGYGDEKVVKNVSLIIPKGKVTAIIGPNGSGKTTVLRLLDRLYPDYEGNICIGDENSKNISLRKWRERFAVVSQNASLFEGTIRDNITYGLENVSEEEISSVVKLACLEDVIASHQGGLRFNVGVNGEKLSGGERQRVAIARAMIKNADYLVLDESTANLDPITEKKVRDSIETLKKGRTVIMVAHNYSAIANADKIIVLNDGVVEDEGTSDELLGTNSFFKLFKAE